MKSTILCIQPLGLAFFLMASLSYCAKDEPMTKNQSSISRINEDYMALDPIYAATCVIESIMMDNEFQPNEEGKYSSFSANPLMLNGGCLNYLDFNLKTQGTLTVEEGNPESKKTIPVPFHIYLRRGGDIVTQGASDPKREVTSIDLATVLAIAKPADHLIIEPVRKRDWKAKRILRLFGAPGC